MRGLSVVVRAMVALCLVCTGLFVAVPSVGAVCTNPPGTYQVTLWSDANYSGPQCVTLGVGNYRNAAAMGITNDWTSSVKVGSGVRARLFQDDDYIGFEATYTADAPTMGAANEKVSSAIISYDYQEPLYLYSSTGFNQTWSTDAQGLAVQPWVATFITQTQTLWRIAAGTSYTGINCNSPGVICQSGFPPQLSAYNHYGDPDYYNGHVLVPLEGSTPAVAVFNASTLAFEGWDYLGSQATNAAWVSVNPSTGKLWSSDGNIQNSNGNRLWFYTLNWGSLCTSGPPTCDFVGTGSSWNVYRRTGYSPDLRYVQGGDFTTDGNKLYLSNGYYTCSGGQYDSARLIDIPSQYIVAEGDDELIGQFAVENHCGWSQYEEMEGIDVDASNEVHIWVLDNNYPGNDILYWKIYLTYN